MPARATRVPDDDIAGRISSENDKVAVGGDLFSMAGVADLESQD
jgi:hypothetical protein